MRHYLIKKREETTIKDYLIFQLKFFFEKKIKYQINIEVHHFPNINPDRCPLFCHAIRGLVRLVDLNISILLVYLRLILNELKMIITM